MRTERSWELVEPEIRELTEHLTPIEVLRVVRMGLSAYRHVRQEMAELELENADLKEANKDATKLV